MSKKNIKQPYIDALSKDERIRYEFKIGLIGLDQYEVTKDLFTTDYACLPRIKDLDIVCYLLYSKSAYTLDQLRAHKSLDAYNQFVNGWVRDVCSLERNGYKLVMGKVKHSQSMNETALRPWIIAKPDGMVECAHCNCKAGLGEVCSHVGALLFFVQTASNIENNKTVTQKKAYWLLPSAVDKVEYSAIQNIDFTSAQTKKRKLDCEVNGEVFPKRNNLKLPIIPEPTSTEISSFRTQLSQSSKRASVLSVCKEFQEDFVPEILKEGQLPTPLMNLKDDRFMVMSEKELHEECRNIFNSMHVTEAQSRNCERLTQGQSSCKEWFTLRHGRITASNMKSVCAAQLDNPAITTVESICGLSSNKFSNKATKWGRDHESEALNAYSQILVYEHEHPHVEKCGLYISPSFPHIGASPDGNVKCDCCGEGLVEIKCPYSARDKKISEANLDFLTAEGHLKNNHRYYYQVQTQLLVTEKAYCDFLVWTEQDISVQRLVADDADHNEIIRKSEQFFVAVILPELTGSLVTKKRQQALQERKTNEIVTVVSTKQNTKEKKSENDELICVCQKIYNEDDDDVIGCDNENCRYKWFHFSCIGMKKIPKGSYFCRDCKTSKKKECKL